MTREEMDKATKELWDEYVGIDVDTKNQFFKSAFALVELLNRKLFGDRQK